MKPPQAIPRPREFLNQLSQSRAFAIGIDFPRHAEVLHRRHIHEKATRQSDVRSDARTLLRDRLLGDLYQDLLAFFQ